MQKSTGTGYPWPWLSMLEESEVVREAGREMGPIEFINQVREEWSQFVCHLFLLPWMHPAEKHNQSLTPRHGRHWWVSGLANSNRNVKLSGELEWRCYWDWGTKERGVWTWLLGSQSPKWSLVSSPKPATSKPYFTPWGSWRNVPWGQARSSFFNLISVGWLESLCPWLSLESRDVLSHQPPARKRERYEVLGS